MKKILMSLVVMALAVAAISGGTFAYFSDTETSTANTFTSGTLDMVLSGGTPIGDSVIGTWVSPANWLPGQTFSATLQFTNVGSIDSHHIWFKFYNLQHNDNGGDGSNLMDVIIVNNLQERFNGKTTGNQAAKIDSQVGNNDGVLTLRELTGWMTGAFGFYTNDDQNLPTDDNVIGAGNLLDYDFILGFTFAATAGNEYQGDSCSFDMELQATQNTETVGMISLH